MQKKFDLGFFSNRNTKRLTSIFIQHLQLGVDNDDKVKKHITYFTKMFVCKLKIKDHSSEESYGDTLLAKFN